MPSRRSNPTMKSPGLSPMYPIQTDPTRKLRHILMRQEMLDSDNFWQRRKASAIHDSNITESATYLRERSQSATRPSKQSMEPLPDCYTLLPFLTTKELWDQHLSSPTRETQDIVSKFCRTVRERYLTTNRKSLNQRPVNRCTFAPYNCGRTEVIMENRRQKICPFQISGQIEPVMPNLGFVGEDASLFKDMQRIKARPPSRVLYKAEECSDDAKKCSHSLDTKSLPVNDQPHLFEAQYIGPIARPDVSSNPPLQLPPSLEGANAQNTQPVLQGLGTNSTPIWQIYSQNRTHDAPRISFPSQAQPAATRRQDNKITFTDTRSFDIWHRSQKRQPRAYHPNLKFTQALNVTHDTNALNPNDCNVRAEREHERPTDDKP
ncbi:hypothetical protein BU24DRAFT_454298 [Aaosphaeria arxii CBS 175.79]|uniref:Uncharacterized protein n=1 Tax=Aaosphaeria arxii CBS 175.79 TaxID=1450172 RepID=A0A6A5XCK9_9PLEO|nr:uncharacterized protein BU24DRAFT_454298 [Aaosphaeria arxii CBS 175.79]KAF2010708.1 hypothetical protein BU24DRAFT_454298 [Aaosphaeria arxii CBS 175.79]